MALTISTGFVVDDAIVMIENIARYIEAGEKPFEAALKGAGQIGFTIVSLTVSLVAVLIPLLFMGGLIGRLFREFAVTLAASIGVSALLSLTLTPMMCAYLLRPEPKEHERGALYRWSERAFEGVIAFYDRGPEGRASATSSLTLLVTIATLGVHGRARDRRPEGVLPAAGHRGSSLGVSEAAPDVSFPKMMELQRTLADVVLADPDVQNVASFIGSDGTNPTTNSGRLSITLKPRDQRSLERRRDHRATAAEARAGRRDPGLPAVRAGPADRQPRQPDAVPVHARGRRPDRAGGLGAAASSTELRKEQRHARTSPAIRRRRASRRRSRSTATPPRASASRRR